MYAALVIGGNSVRFKETYILPPSMYDDTETTMLLAPAVGFWKSAVDVQARFLRTTYTGDTYPANAFLLSLAYTFTKS